MSTPPLALRANDRVRSASGFGARTPPATRFQLPTQFPSEGFLVPRFDRPTPPPNAILASRLRLVGIRRLIRHLGLALLVYVQGCWTTPATKAEDCGITWCYVWAYPFLSTDRCDTVNDSGRCAEDSAVLQGVHRTRHGWIVRRPSRCVAPRRSDPASR